jgi:hypothetical protein
MIRIDQTVAGVVSARPRGERYNTSIVNTATAHIMAKLHARALIPRGHSKFSKERPSKKPALLSFAFSAGQRKPDFRRNCASSTTKAVTGTKNGPVELS